MVQTTKIKVDRNELIDALEKRRDAMKHAYAESLIVYAAKTVEFQVQVKNILLDALDAIEAGVMPNIKDNNYNSSIVIHHGKDGVSEPRNPTLNTAKLDRLITMLAMSTEETITLSSDDAAEYLG